MPNGVNGVERVLRARGWVSLGHVHERIREKKGEFRADIPKNKSRDISSLGDGGGDGDGDGDGGALHYR